MSPQTRVRRFPLHRVERRDHRRAWRPLRQAIHWGPAGPPESGPVVDGPAAGAGRYPPQRFPGV